MRVVRWWCRVGPFDAPSSETERIEKIWPAMISLSLSKGATPSLSKASRMACHERV
jgi:hypothetical protein